MKHRRGGSDNESSGNEAKPRVDFLRNGYEDEDDFFENSQELTQIIPRKSGDNASDEEPSQKRKKRKKDRRREPPESPDPESHFFNGYHVREMDTSEIPGHIIANMKRVVPKESDCSEELTVEAVQKAASSSKGGVWIIKCPRDVNLSDLLPGKKLSLDGEPSIIEIEDEDDSAQLTQFLPKDSLGVNVKDRQFEATSVINDDYEAGAVLVLPEANKFKLVAAPIQGHIIIRECVRELKFPHIKTPNPIPRKLPSGIKERHPVYGADFTKIVDEMESAPKKKRKKCVDPDNHQSDTSGGFQIFPPLITPKIEIESDDSTHKRKKNNKKNAHDDLDGRPSYQNGFANSSTFTDILDEEISIRKKKSKKRKREELEESYQDMDKTVLIEVSEPSSKKLKKSKNKSFE